MAFKRVPNETFSTPITVNVPNNKGGFDKNTFVAKWKRPALDEINNNSLRDLKNDELCLKMMVDWELRDAETNEDVPFTNDNLHALLQILPTPLATATAFWETVNGARSKN